VDIFFRIFRFKEEELGDNKPGDGIIDRRADEDNPFFQEA